MGVPKKIRRASNPVGVCLEDAFNKFIIEKEALQRSAATVESYQKSYQRFLQSFEGEIDGDTFLCSELTEDTIFEWMAALKNDGIRPQSINHYLRDMRTFVNWCKKKEYISIQLFLKLGYRLRGLFFLRPAHSFNPIFFCLAHSSSSPSEDVSVGAKE